MLDFEGFNLKKIFIINFVSIMDGNGVNNVFLYWGGGFISCVQILMVNILMINCGDLKLQGVEGYWIRYSLFEEKGGQLGEFYEFVFRLLNFFVNLCNMIFFCNMI